MPEQTAARFIRDFYSDDENNLPAGVRFMRMAARSAPQSLSDERYAELMRRTTRLAIDHGFAFTRDGGDLDAPTSGPQWRRKVDDAQALRNLEFHAEHATFEPYHRSLYRHACLTGSDFASLWEAAHDIRPFLAHATLAYEMGTVQTYAPPTCRMAQGLGIMLKTQPHEVDAGWMGRMADRYGVDKNHGTHLWWCAGIDLPVETGTPKIRLYAYRQGVPLEGVVQPPFDAFTKTIEDDIKSGRINRDFWISMRTPCATLTLDHAQWDALMAREREAETNTERTAQRGNARHRG